MVAIVEKKEQQRKEKLYSLREYLDRESRSVNKHEFHNGKIITMAGGKFGHNEIATNFVTSLKWAVKPLPTKFRVINSDQKIFIKAINKAVYPDALVVCEAPEYWEDREDLIVNPLLIVEVLSKSTRDFDKSGKFMLYQTLPSFREYVLVEQNLPSVEAWFRTDEMTWNKKIQEDLAGSIALRSLGVSISLADIYENITFPKKK
jgi:Uma2 family endonuclease